jgi:hypothetical protein
VITVVVPGFLHFSVLSQTVVKQVLPPNGALQLRCYAVTSMLDSALAAPGCTRHRVYADALPQLRPIRPTLSSGPESERGGEEERKRVTVGSNHADARTCHVSLETGRTVYSAADRNVCPNLMFRERREVHLLSTSRGQCHNHTIDELPVNRCRSRPLSSPRPDNTAKRQE